MPAGVERQERTPGTEHRAVWSALAFFLEQALLELAHPRVDRRQFVEVAITALARFGALKGSWMAVKRILRCNPFSKGGYDPVPELPDAVLRRD